MSHPVFDHLVRPIITDGAWGTELQARGLGLGEAPDLWNLTHPDTVAAVAAAYVAAGAQIILTNTFGANRFRLATDTLGLINARGVALSRDAAGKAARVFASMGPSGKRLGDVSPTDLASAFAEQAEAIAAAKPDGIVIETMQDLQEATIATAAAKATGLPVVVTMVFDSGPDRDHTLTGATPEHAAEVLVKAGADVIGANCADIAGLIAVCARLKAAGRGRPIWIKANAGLPKVENGKLLYATTAQDFASYVPALVAAGASFIGGCCGVGPDFIAAVKASIKPR